MNTTLVITNAQASELQAASERGLESAGVILAKPVEAKDGNLRLLVQGIYWVPDDAYETRTANGMQVRSHGYVPALGMAARDGAVPIWMHTHPGGGDPTPSQRDRIVEQQLAGLFRDRSRSQYYGALIVSADRGSLRFAGALTTHGGEVRTIDRIWSVGERFQLLLSTHTRRTAISPMFDRSIRAFGPDVQHTLGELHVGIVGCGGTGSAVAEQLARLGIRRFTLLDAQVLEETNTTRVYGAFASDVGRPKADLLADHLSKIDPALSAHAIRSKVTSRIAARQLTDCDLIFGCTDDQAGRLILSRLSSILLTPVIDMGVLLDSTNEVLNGIFGRVTVLSPGAACLICRGRVNAQVAATEMLPQEERMRLVAEGYAPEMPGVDPAVVTFTTMVAAQATSEMLNRLTGFGSPSFPSELLVLPHEHRIRMNNLLPRLNHYCDPTSKLFGSGVADPFLGLTWTE